MKKKKVNKRTQTTSTMPKKHSLGAHSKKKTKIIGLSKDAEIKTRKELNESRFQQLLKETGFYDYFYADIDKKGGITKRWNRKQKH
jgi:hypothetical protein